METEAVIAEIVRQTRESLREKILFNSPIESFKPLNTIFRGHCGTAQCLTGYGLEDCGVTVKPIATQSLRGCAFPHAALSAAGEDKLYIVDSTFSQFCANSARGSDNPEGIMSQTTEGEYAVRQLVEHGYVEASPSLAYLYFRAFCKGNSPFMDEKQAFDFLKDPGSNPYHFLDTRETLRLSGYVIPHI